MTKRLLALLLALIMTVSLLPCTVFAVEETVTEEAEMESAVSAEVEEIISETTEEEPAAEMAEEEPAAEVVEETASETTAKEPAVEAAEEKPALKLLGLAQEPEKFGEGEYTLTIVNDAAAPAKYTVKIGERATQTVLLQAKGVEGNMGAFGINEGETYSVDVEYPESYQVKNKVCTFTSPGAPGEEVKLYCGETWTQTVGEPVSTTIYEIHTKANTEPYGYATKAEVFEGTSSTAFKGPYYLAKKNQKAVWTTAGQWMIRFNHSDTNKAPDLTFKLYYATNSGATATKGGVLSGLFTDREEYVSQTVTYSLDDPRFITDSAGAFLSLENEKQQKERVLAVMEALKSDVYAILKESPLDEDSFTYDFSFTPTVDNLTFTVSKGKYTLKVKDKNTNTLKTLGSSNNGFFFAYQLVEERNPLVNCTSANITLTYSADVPQIQNLSLDILNAERYRALENMDEELIRAILAEDGLADKLPKDKEISLDMLAEKPDSAANTTLGDILNTVAMKTASAALSTKDMPKVSAITIEEVLDEEFCEGISPEELSPVTYQMSFASSVFANINLPGQLNVILDLNEKGQKDKAIAIIQGLAFGANSDSIKKMLERVDLMWDSAVELLEEVKDLYLPIRLGYTYTADTVLHPGKYKVKVSPVGVGWSGAGEYYIVVDKNGAITAEAGLPGLETRETAVMENLTDLIEVDSGVYQDTIDMIYQRIQGDDIKRDQNNKKLLEGPDNYDTIHMVLYGLLDGYALFSNTGIWFDHGIKNIIGEAGQVSTTRMTNSIEFKSVTPNGEALPGATYMLINRDQFIELISGLIELGEDVVNSVSGNVDSLDFNGLKALYNKISSGSLEIDQETLLAAIQTGKNLSNIDLPAILMATSDESGIVHFDASCNVSVGKLTSGISKTYNFTIETTETVKAQIAAVEARLKAISDSYHSLKSKIKGIGTSISTAVKYQLDSFKGFLIGVKEKVGAIFGKLFTVANAKELPIPDITIPGFTDKISSETLKALLYQVTDEEFFEIILELTDKAEDLGKIIGNIAELLKPEEPVTPPVDPPVNPPVNPPVDPPVTPDEPEEPKPSTIELVMTLIKDFGNNELGYAALNLVGLLDGKFPTGDYILMQVSAPEGYIRNPACYTLHNYWDSAKGEFVTTAQRGILTPMLAESGKALEKYLDKLNPNVQKILGSVKSTAQGSIDTMSTLWNSLNQFSLTKNIANGIRDAIIADVAAAVYRVVPGYFRNVNDVIDEINTALTQIEKLGKTPTFDDLLHIAEGLIVGDLGEPVVVNTNWKFYNIAKPAEKAA